MSRASLGVADCGKRLSIADEGVVQTARQTGERNWICLEKDERRMDAQTDRVCYIILYSLVLLQEILYYKFKFKIYEKCKSSLVTPSHIM